MDNPEKIEGAIKTGQSRKNRRGNQEWTIQRKQKGQSKIDSPEKLVTYCAQNEGKQNIWTMAFLIIYDECNDFFFPIVNFLFSSF